MDKIPPAHNNIKDKLDSILVDGQSEDGLVRVVSSGNKEIKQVWIDKTLIEKRDKKAIEDLTKIAINRALAKADEVIASEIENISKNTR